MSLKKQQNLIRRLVSANVLTISPDEKPADVIQRLKEAGVNEDTIKNAVGARFYTSGHSKYNKDKPYKVVVDAYGLGRFIREVKDVSPDLVNDGGVSTLLQHNDNSLDLRRGLSVPRDAMTFGNGAGAVSEQGRKDMEEAGIPATGLDAELEADMARAKQFGDEEGTEPSPPMGRADETTAPATEDTAKNVEMTVSDEDETHNEPAVGDDVGEVQPPTEQSHQQSAHQRQKDATGEGIDQAEGTMRNNDDEEALAEDAPEALAELQRIASEVAEAGMTEEEPVGSRGAGMGAPVGEPITEKMAQEQFDKPLASLTQDELRQLDERQPDDRPPADMPPTDSYQNLLVSSGLMSRPQYYERQLRTGMSMIGHHSQKLAQLPADNYSKLSNKQLADYIDAQIKIYGRKIGVARRLASVTSRKDMEQEAHEITALVNMWYMARLGVSSGVQTGVIIPAEMLGGLAPQLQQMSQQLRQQNRPQQPQQVQPQGRQGFGQSQYAQQLGMPMAPSQFAQQSKPRQINTTQRNEFVGRLGLRDRVKMNSARQEARKSQKLEGLMFG